MALTMEVETADSEVHKMVLCSYLALRERHTLTDTYRTCYKYLWRTFTAHAVDHNSCIPSRTTILIGEEPNNCTTSLYVMT